MRRETPAQAMREVLLFAAQSLEEGARDGNIGVAADGWSFDINAPRRRAMKKLAADLRARAKGTT